MAEPTGQGLLTEDPPATTPPETNWRDSVSEEHRSGISKFGSVGELAKSYIELEGAMGSRIKVPAEDAPEEERSAFYNKLGRPENADGYELPEVPEGLQHDEEFEKTMRNIAYKAGAPKAQFLQLVKGYYEFLAAKLHRSKEEGERTLHEDWGADYDKNLEVAKRACTQFGGEEFTKLLVDTGLGSNPTVVKTFLEIGKVNLDDSFVKGEPAKSKEEFVPANVKSPEMYASGEDEYSKKARAYFEARGHVY